MPGNRLHPADDEIQEALDDRLPATRRSEIEGHLASCGECRGKWVVLSWAKAQAGSAGVPEPPPDLASRVLRALDDEDARKAVSGIPQKQWRFRGRPFWAMTTVAAVLLAVVSIVLIARRPDMPQAVVRDYQAFRTGALTLDVQTSDIQELEAHLAKARLPFPVRVLDLGMMRYRLVGGKVHDVGGRPTALVVYRGANGHTLLCEMHRGSLAELPAGGEPHEHGGISFRVFQRGEVTLAFWPEGDVLCVLAGEGGSETILPLAFGKAMKAARRSAFSLLGAEDGAVSWLVSVRAPAARRALHFADGIPDHPPRIRPAERGGRASARPDAAGLPAAEAERPRLRARSRTSRHHRHRHRGCGDRSFGREPAAVAVRGGARP